MPPRPGFGREVLLVLAGLLAVSFAIRILDLDLRVARLFYRPGGDPAWVGIGRQPWAAIYRFGTWPANIVGGLGLVGALASLAWKELRRHRRSLLLMTVVLAVGSGLVVNLLLKDTWGRPRPRDCVEFGGAERFVPVGAIGHRGGGNSFPSGHAANGFYFLTLYVLWRGRRSRAAAAGAAGGLAAGSLLGLQRILVGAHFLSDVIWSGGVVYLTAICADRILPDSGERWPAGAASIRN